MTAKLVAVFENEGEQLRCNEKQKVEKKENSFFGIFQMESFMKANSKNRER
jgi:hypothetical protein